MRTLKPILQEAIKKNNNFELDLSSLDESQYAAVTSEEHNVLLRASAGSGKTKSLIAAIAAYRYENINDRICAITYTRAARAEMEQRLQDMGIYDVEVTTIHVWARNLLQHYSIQYGFKVQILEEKDIKLILFDLVNRYTKVRNVKVNLNILYSFITGNKNMDITDGYRKTLKALEDRYIQYKRNNLLYDFMDYPLYLYDIMRIYNETIEDIDALFVDEFQDVDAIQFDIFQKVHAKKKFFVGDSWQCQPAGTKVLVRTKNGGVEKNIEDLEIGEPIVFYDQSKGYVSGSDLPYNAIIKTVLEKQEHEYKNNYLITIETESGLKSSYTANHRTFVRFNRPSNKEAHVVYLMCNSEYRFRVGKIPLYYTSTAKTNNSWQDKMRAEGCTKIWFLKVFDNDHDARVEEAKVSYQYGIPQTYWQTTKVQWSEKDIEYIYSQIDTKNRAAQCLKDYHLDINFPLVDEELTWSKRCHFTSNASSEIYAINLIPEFMDCLVYGSDTSHKNLHSEQIVSVTKEYIPEDKPIKVYALKVEDGTYVADRIITHNSIFVFRGADGEVFHKIEQDDRDFKSYKLMYNYRSYQEIINYATTVYHTLYDKVSYNQDCYIAEVFHSYPCDIICSRGYGGTVTVISPWGELTRFGAEGEIDILTALKETLHKRPMILCRTNKQVRAIQDYGYSNVSTVHQAKGLEYNDVIIIDSTIDDVEDLNVAYVALTRARNSMLIINWQQFEFLMQKGILQEVNN